LTVYSYIRSTNIHRKWIFAFPWQQWVEERATPLCQTYNISFSLLFSVCSVEFRSNNPNSCRPVRPDSKFLHIRNLWFLPNLTILWIWESIVKLVRVSESQDLPQQYFQLENSSISSIWIFSFPIPDYQSDIRSSEWRSSQEPERHTVSWLWNNNDLQPTCGIKHFFNLRSITLSFKLLLLLLLLLKFSESVADFLGWKVVLLWIKVGKILHENLFISTIQPTTKVAVTGVTNSLNYYISQTKV
jgi:hypothetical protein